MSHYHAYPNGYLTLDNDPTPVVEITRVDNGVRPGPEWQAARKHRLVSLAELASDGNHAREWAERAAQILAWGEDHINITRFIDVLLREMAEYHRDGVTA